MRLVGDRAVARSIVFLDRGIDDAAGLAAGTRPGIALAWLEPGRAALDQIADRLADGPPVGALHVVSHGRPGALCFAAGEVDAAGLSAHAGALARIRGALAPDAEVLLYGCSVAEGRGAGFVRDLSRNLGATVHASATPTGSARLGGDWSFHTGTPHAPPAFTDDARARFPGVLSIMGLLVTLTTGADNPFLDVVNDTIEANATDALNANDTINGNTGTDTLNITASQAAITLTATTLTNIETINVSNGATIDITTNEATVANTATLTVNASTNTASIAWNGAAETDGGKFALTGGSAADTLIGGAGADTIAGGGGADSISGGAGGDRLAGDDGNDTIYGDAGSDLLTGGNGNDLIYGGGDADLVYGGDGNDTVYGGDGGDLLSGGNANDLVHGEAGNDTIYGGLGDDTLYGGDNNDSLFGQDGNDLMVGGAGNDDLTGGAGNDTIYGDDGDDTLYGDDGNDVLYGGAGLDEMTGGNGDDVLFGSSGTDFLDGGANNDTLYGEDGSDLLTGDAGDDLLYAGDGNDLVYGNNGNDVLYGGTGFDTLYGGADNDTLISGFGSSTLYGGDGHDVMSGSTSADTMSGGAGNDTYVADNTNDDFIEAVGEGTDLVQFSGANASSFTLGANIENLTLTGTSDISGIGNALDNLIVGNIGNNTLSGGAGSDTYSGAAGNDVIIGSTSDLNGDSISGFDAGDVIRVTGAGAELTTSDITLSGNTLTLDSDGTPGADITLTVTGVDSTAVFSVSVSGGDALISYTVPPPPASPPAASDDSTSPPTTTTTVPPTTDSSIITVTDNTLTPTLPPPPPTASGLTSTNEVLTNVTTNQTGTAHLVQNTGNTNLVTATLPPQVSLQNEGAKTAQTPAQALADLVNSIEIKQPTNVLLQTSVASNWISTRPAGAMLDVRTIIPSISGGSSGATLSGPIVLSGSTSGQSSSFQEAFVIDTSNLPSGSVLQLDNIEFASIIGSATITGGLGASFAIADDAEQFISLGEDDDTLLGGGGNDTIASSAGDDILYGNQGNDLVTGGADNDTLYGGQNSDLVYGNTENDLLYGNMADDTLYGGQGDDVAYGGQGDDLLYGNAGNDTLAGSDGDDLVHGNAGDDEVAGGEGDDTLVGGAGNDLMSGGDGADRFRVLLTEDGSTLGGNDTIADFSEADGDMIQVEAQSVATIGSDASGNAVIMLTNGGTITLDGVSSSEFSISLFEVVSTQASPALSGGAPPFGTGFQPPTSPPATVGETAGRASEPLVTVETVGVPPDDEAYHMFGAGGGP